MLPSSILIAIQAVAVGEVSIDGLALSCFNKAARRWEVAFIRHPDHRLVITVQLIDNQNEEVGVILPPTEIGDVRSIDVTLANGSDNHLGLFPDGGVELPGFSRAGQDSPDIRWAIDLGDVAVGHGNVTGLKRRGPQQPDRLPVTLARIPHTLFYTNEVTTSSVILSPRSDNAPGASPPFGRTNDDTAGVIFADRSTSVNIVSDPPGVVVVPPLTPVPNHYYRIVFTNMDREGTMHDRRDGRVRGDHHHFYNIVAVDGDERDLWAIPRRARNESGDCNPEIIKHPNIDTLEPLIMD
ncbi:MAG TPA: hypothetical protein VJS44_01615 [Pyrinomonadaceae bacterium]|nr:hypothetical protein [Pyrinomonadaceae bacterium]